jgi:hypothetical protein
VKSSTTTMFLWFLSAISYCLVVLKNTAMKDKTHSQPR